MDPLARPAGRGPQPETWIPAVYALLSAIWIAASDDALALLVQGKAELEFWQTIKGWGFVVVTAWLLRVGLRHILAERQAGAQRLATAERRARRLVETSPDAIFIQAGLSVVFANEAAARLVGASRPALLVGRSILDFLDPSEHASAMDRSSRVVEGRSFPQTLVRLMRRLDGSTFRAEVAVAPLEQDGERSLQITARDVTHAWTLQEEVRRVNRALRTLGSVNEALVRAGSEAELMDEVCRIAVEDGGYTMAWIGFGEKDERRTIRAVAICGAELGVVQGLRWGDEARPRDLAGIAIRTGHVEVINDLTGDPRAAHRRELDRHHGHRSEIALPLSAGGDRRGVLVLCAAEPDAFQAAVVQLLRQLVDDLTFGLAALETSTKLRESREQLRALAGRLQTVREEEKTRMARDLHDELGQLLTGLKMDLRWLEKRLGELPPGDAISPLLDRTVAASELADQTVASVQRIAAELRPGALDRLGLVPALRQEVRRFQERTGIACAARVDEAAPEAPPEVATALYRICQEALTNVSRHAGARQVEVALEAAPRALVLRVTDDGRGLDDVALGPEALGLLGMTERATLLGGEVVFSRRPEGGTVVTARLPVLDADGADR